MKVFIHMGTSSQDYRTIMKNQTDYIAGDRHIGAGQTVIAEQVAGDMVHVCTPYDAGAGFGDHPQIPDADALVTDIPGLYLMVRTADCYPILMHDRDNRVVAAVHSGREGTRLNVVGKTVAELVSRFGVVPGDICTYIGPGICPEHYEVDAETWDAYNKSMCEQGFYPDLKSGRKIDIRVGIFQQLIQAGIPFINIEQQHICTYGSNRHFSYRRDGTRNRQINIIGIDYE
jgi:YfiH family protein